MTSFDVLESSVQGSRPIEVYSIALGSETFRYTSAEDAISLGADVYEPVPIARGSIAQGSDASRRELVITLPGDNEFARRYTLVVPGERATVSIIRLQRDESPTFATQVLVYKGRVQAVRFSDDGKTAEVALQSIESAKSQRIPRFTYMGMCNHVLYDQGCKVDPNLFSVTDAVSAVVGNVITVPAAAGFADGFFTGGFAKPAAQSDYRMVLSHVGASLTLLLPFAEDVVGQSVQVFAGCDRRLTGDCSNKFDNAIEFGGFAFVPKKNPFEGLD